jgi:hypothetical protein
VTSSLLLILGVATLSLAFRAFHNAWFQKLGAFGVLVTSYLAGWLLTGYWPAGAACALSWFLLPWLEILTRVRKLRLPVEKNLRHKTPPNSENFPAIHELTDEIEQEKFEHIDDAGWDWDDCQQFFRLFYKEDERAQAAICFIDQGDVAFYYLSIASRACDGTIWTTWNYPFSHSLKLVPELKINRLRAEDSFLQLHESHRSFLQKNGITIDNLQPLDAEKIALEMQQDLRAQIAHNVAQGVLTKTAEGQIRYSWRGMFFIWFQFLRDIVRLS